MSRLPVRKTYKLFIGGAFPRSESGRTYEAEGQNVARASRKDARDAVQARRGLPRLVPLGRVAQGAPQLEAFGLLNAVVQTVELEQYVRRVAVFDEWMAERGSSAREATWRDVRRYAEQRVKNTHACRAGCRAALTAAMPELNSSDCSAPSAAASFCSTATTVGFS